MSYHARLAPLLPHQLCLHKSAARVSGPEASLACIYRHVDDTSRIREIPSSARHPLQKGERNPRNIYYIFILIEDERSILTLMT
jgi:hypothetical protein